MGGPTNFMKIYEPRYDEQTGTYYDPAGMRLERVTDILGGELDLYYGYSEYYAERGSDVHTAIRLFTENDINEAGFTAEVLEYLECYRRAVADRKIIIAHSEVRRYHKLYRYTGAMDAIATVDGVQGIIDFKSGLPAGWHKWQLALYAELVKHEFPGVKPARWNLYLRPGAFDGLGYKLVRQDGKSDLTEALTLLSAFLLKKREGYIKEKRKKGEQHDG